MPVEYMTANRNLPFEKSILRIPVKAGRDLEEYDDTGLIKSEVKYESD